MKGCRLKVLCSAIGISIRTVQRWKSIGFKDRRCGPKTNPKKLSLEEKSRIKSYLTSEEFCDLSPWQIVPILADRGEYIASTSSFFRVLREFSLNKHRGISKKPQRREKIETIAKEPNKVWCWDITKLWANQRTYFYAYVFIDLYSRKIVLGRVYEREESINSEYSFKEALVRENISGHGLRIHSDNGSPMRAKPLLSLYQNLGVQPSYSRPRVKNDNPYSEALFRTLKYHPCYPDKPFSSIESAQVWLDRFVKWYNEEHLHKNLNYVTPDQKHRGLDVAILKKRCEIFAAARMRAPMRWSKHSNQWLPTTEVSLPSEGTRLLF